MWVTVNKLLISPSWNHTILIMRYLKCLVMPVGSPVPSRDILVLTVLVPFCQCWLLPLISIVVNWVCLYWFILLYVKIISNFYVMQRGCTLMPYFSLSLYHLQPLLAIFSFTLRYLSNIDCLSFVMCLLLALVFQGFFFAVAINSTN